VVAAAVILDRRRFRGLLRRELDDSKVLTRETREVCCRALFACAKIGVAPPASARSTASTSCAPVCARWRAPSPRWG
jgi:ribonuclease HII